MTVLRLPVNDAINFAQSARSIVNPNLGFRKQLESFEKINVEQVRYKIF